MTANHIPRSIEIDETCRTDQISIEDLNGGTGEDSEDVLPVWVCQKGFCNDEMPERLRCRLSRVSL